MGWIEQVPIYDLQGLNDQHFKTIENQVDGQPILNISLASQNS